MFLDRLYPNRFSDLKPGRIRYGVISSDAGRIVDDGTICRLDDETFYVTTTSSGAGAVEEWFGWWLADWKLDVRLTDLTQGMAAVNLAGPRAREIISAADRRSTAPTRPSNTSTASTRTIAGVRCLVLRIGFVGELGYEIHCPAALRRARLGRADGGRRAARPAAVRARAPADPAAAEACTSSSARTPTRSRRRTRPRCRGSSSSTRTQDFIGSWALRARRRARRRRRRSSASRSPNGDVPTEGAVVLGEDGAPAGQVTSSRHSPQLARSDRDGVGAGGAGARRRQDHDLRRRPAAARPTIHDPTVLRPRRGGAAVMSALDFLPVGRGRRRAGAVPMERRRSTRARRIRARDGWNVAVSYPRGAVRRGGVLV